MNKHARIFLGTFLPTAGVAAAFVIAQRATVALAVGAVGLAIHWALSAGDEHDGELADSSYFFGFLLTLTFLAAGLSHLASPAPGQNSSASVLGFLEELGAGLALTILGLVIRQVRTLSWNGRTAAPADALTDAQRELATAMRTLVRALDSRPEEVASQELHETRAKAREATESLERSVLLAAERVDNAMRQLEETTTGVTAGLLRASSGLGSSLTTSLERIQLEVGAVLSLLEAQRRQLETSLRESQSVSESTQQEIGERMRAQLAEWRATLEESRAYLATAHASIGGEYQQGLAALRSAGSTFSALAQQVAAEVSALPNPGERLVGLWDGVRSLEATLAQSIDGASERLAALGRESDGAAGAMKKLERSTALAAGNIERGGAELADALRRELTQMNDLLDEYTRLLERDLAAAGPR